MIGLAVAQNDVEFYNISHHPLQSIVFVNTLCRLTPSCTALQVEVCWNVEQCLGSCRDNSIQNRRAIR